LYSMFFAVCVYYLVKLYLFYKRLNNITLRTKDSLYETYFDIRLNMELYKTFTFALSPFIVLFFVGFTVYLVSTKPGMQISDLSNSFLTATFVVISLTILFLGLMAEWWVQYFYGKYAKEIKKVIDELKEE
jgi:predicted DNA-binding transcriptional regulator